MWPLAARVKLIGDSRGTARREREMGHPGWQGGVAQFAQHSSGMTCDQTMEIVLVAVGTDFCPPACRLKLPAVIGRDDDVATLVIRHPLVSREHCHLEAKDGCVIVHDPKSTNGTFVGSRRIRTAVCPFGEFLVVGPIVFRVESSDASLPGVRWCSAEEMGRLVAEKQPPGNAGPPGSARDTQPGPMR